MFVWKKLKLEDRQGMVKESRAEAKLGVGVETLWRALVKDLRFIIPKLIPNTVDKIELLHGNGGLGSVFLFHLAPGMLLLSLTSFHLN